MMVPMYTVMHSYNYTLVKCKIMYIMIHRLPVSSHMVMSGEMQEENAERKCNFSVA